MTATDDVYLKMILDPIRNLRTTQAKIWSKYSKRTYPKRIL